MKIKTSYLIYAVIGTVFAGLSMFTDIFEKGKDVYKRQSLAGVKGYDSLGERDLSSTTVSLTGSVSFGQVTVKH